MSSINLSDDEKKTCHDVAHESILHGLSHGSALHILPDEYSQTLQENFATFVTLHKHGELRGCIGSLEAYQPLIKDIAEHAYAAAFNDPRFPSLKKSEYDEIDIEISVLGKPERIIFDNEEDLLEKIRPNIDGLILEYAYNRGTFLPSVWEQLPDKEEFLNHLKMKAGLPINWWDKKVKISRYETLSF